MLFPFHNVCQDQQFSIWQPTELFEVKDQIVLTTPGVFKGISSTKRSWHRHVDECAANDGKAPADCENYLPWNLSDDRLNELRSPTLNVPADSS